MIQQAFRIVFIDDFWLKLFSLALALFVLFYVTEERSTVAEISVRLTVVAPENSILNSPESFSFTIKVRGPNDVIEKIPRPYEVLFKPPSSFDKETERVVKIDEGVLNLPALVSLISSPNPITVHLDELVTVTLPVIPETTGTTAEGYSARIVRAEPEKISISGPKSLIKDLTQLVTDPIDLTGRTVSFDTLVRINAEPANPKIITENRMIRVFISVRPILIEKEFTVPVRFAQGSDGRYYTRSVTPATVRITIRGPQSAMERIDESQIFVYINTEAFNMPGIHSDVLTRVILPNEIELVGTAPRVEIFLIDKP